MLTWILLIMTSILLLGLHHWFLLAILVTVCLLHGWNRGSGTTNQS